MIIDLKYNEIIFIEIQRVFHTFLVQNGYYLDFYHYRNRDIDRDYDELRFSNNKLHKSVVFGMIPFQISILRKFKSIFYSIKKDRIEIVNIKYYYDQNQDKANTIINYFEDYKNLSNELPIENSFTILKSYKEFMENKLMPIIKGEMWIDELLKKVGLK
ncbi:MAG: hypothetical protein HW421_1020 [Ignavibacteria bacterium]|nr:hypothetical protein [Ignavibacteria bacterium]